MKKTISIFLAAAVILLAYTPKAQAGNDGWAAFGGFLGGVIVSSIGHDIRKHRHNSSCGHHGGAEIRYGRNYGSSHRSNGHYEYRTIKRWSPGYWEYQERYCDTPIKVWVAGHYDYHKEKVWVRDYGHHSGYNSHHYTYYKRSGHHRY